MTLKHMKVTFSPDYAQFSLEDGNLVPGERMQKKLDAIPFPDLNGKKVLDVGCDYGQFSYYAALKGASSVLGLDRNRNVKGVGPMNLIETNREVAKHNRLRCSFKKIDLGKQWHEYGEFDVVFMFSMYHHVFENVGDHKPIWFWLYRHCKPGGVVLWENPVDLADVVSDRHISGGKREDYTREKILEAAGVYFDIEHIGGAKHEPHREVYRFTAKALPDVRFKALLQDGAGGASKAFEYLNGRRQSEIENVLGYRPHPGSLNMLASAAFDWETGYYRAEVLDVVERGKGLDVEWRPRWARFYPVAVDGIQSHVFRFEGEKYPLHFIEAISPVRLRDNVSFQAVVTR